MSIHNLAFWVCAFFLIGVFLVSIFKGVWVAMIAGLIFLYFAGFRKFFFALLSLLILAGAGYYQSFSAVQQRIAIPFEAREFSGVIKKIERAATKQGIVLELASPHRGRVKITARPYPSFQYGDRLKVSGIIQKPPSDRENYFLKDGIFGTLNFPKIELVESGQGNFIKARLLQFKDSIIGIFQSALPSEKAALLSGLTMGERADFSKSLEEKMSLSGTTHIVALSGYNISIIAWTLGLIFSGFYFSRTAVFYLSVLIIILFVLMTGAEASVVRAAIMGSILLLAKEVERLFSVRNAIIIAAFLMVLHNPRVLVFDLGFQLSFAALLGIVYLLPVLQKIFGVTDPGFWRWKEHALTTLSAQLAVVPLLLSNFGVFSLTSFFSNILIAEAVPVTMGLGFIMAGLGFISDFLAQMIGLAVNLLLSYELWVIDIFSRFTLPIATESFGFFAAIIYYSALIFLVFALNRKLR